MRILKHELRPYTHKLRQKTLVLPCEKRECICNILFPRVAGRIPLVTKYAAYSLFSDGLRKFSAGVCAPTGLVLHIDR